jgi:hypothetical protein
LRNDWLESQSDDGGPDGLGQVGDQGTPLGVVVEPEPKSGSSAMSAEARPPGTRQASPSPSLDARGGQPRDREAQRGVRRAIRVRRTTPVGWLGRVNHKTVLIRGVQAAGKSTVAQLLAERLPRSVHVEGDVFRRMVVNGRVDMTPDLPAEAIRQLRLRYQFMASTCDTYVRAGFTVVPLGLDSGGSALHLPGRAVPLWPHLVAARVSATRA